MGCDLVRTSAQSCRRLGRRDRDPVSKPVLRFRSDHLGFDISRRLRHKNERDYWSGYDPTLSFSDVSQAGSLSGISNVQAWFRTRQFKSMERSAPT